MPTEPVVSTIIVPLAPFLGSRAAAPSRENRKRRLRAAVSMRTAARLSFAVVRLTTLVASNARQTNRGERAGFGRDHRHGSTVIPALSRTPAREYGPTITTSPGS